MKISMIQLFYMTGILAFMFACNGKPTDENREAGTEKPSAEQRTVSDVVENYLRLKDALVASDLEQAKENAVKLLEVIDATQMPRMQQSAKEIASADNLEVQRVFFDSLSVHLYQRLQETQGNEQLLYKQFCPMAFNNRGAFWLSSNREIRNPYFGEQMMNCGRVEEEVRPSNEKQ